jgi:hypothetical protein
VEAGYIGRILRNEYQGININAVPYMITAGGQTFAKAYAAVDLAYCGGVAGLAGGNCNSTPANITAASSTPQPFFESALGGPTSAYCAPFVGAFPNSPCTAAVVANEGGPNTNNGSNLAVQNVWSLYSDLDNPNIAGFTFGRTMLNTPIKGSAFGASGQLTSGIAENTSTGYGNYNALFFTLKSSDWHGVTSQTNFTWGKALGTQDVVQSTGSFTVVDPYWDGRGYTEQPFDRQYLFNTFMVYAPPVYKSQHGVLGHLLGGWSFSPIFVAGSGLTLGPTDVTANGDGQSFGEADANSFAANEALVPIGPYNTGSASRHTCTNPTTKKLYLCSGPPSGANSFRDPILGFDTGRNASVLRGLPFWNLDFAVVKNTHVTERVSVEFHAMFANFLNHMQGNDPNVDLSNPGGWGVLSIGGFANGQAQANTPRQIELGLRVRF